MMSHPSFPVLTFFFLVKVRQTNAKLAIAKSLSKRNAKLVAEEEKIKKPIFSRTEEDDSNDSSEAGE